MIDPQPIFEALADPTRMRVFERLTTVGPASASKLAVEMPVSRQAIAKHLSVLDSAGLVQRSEIGREVIYTASPSRLGQVNKWVERVGSDWDARLQRLGGPFH